MKDAVRAERHTILSNENRSLELRKMDCTAFAVVDLQGDVVVRERPDCDMKIEKDVWCSRVDNGMGRQCGRKTSFIIS